MESKQHMSATARLHHAQAQYESLLIRAGEIIDHVPGHSESNQDNSFDSSDATLEHYHRTSGDNQLRFQQHHDSHHNHSHSHNHHRHRHQEGNEDDGLPIEIPDMPNIDMSRSFGIGGYSAHSEPHGHPLGASRESQSPPRTAGSLSVTGTSTSASVSASVPTLRRADSDAPVVPDDEKVTIIIALQAEVARLKSKLDDALSSAEETVSELFQAHVSYPETIPARLELFPIFITLHPDFAPFSLYFVYLCAVLPTELLRTEARGVTSVADRSQCSSRS